MTASHPERLWQGQRLAATASTRLDGALVPVPTCAVDGHGWVPSEVQELGRIERRDVPSLPKGRSPECLRAVGKGYTCINLLRHFRKKWLIYQSHRFNGTFLAYLQLTKR